MAFTAYLVGFIDTKAHPPSLKGVGIFSEPGPTIEGFPFVIVNAPGATWEEAEANLRQLMNHPGVSWAKKLMKKEL